MKNNHSERMAQIREEYRSKYLIAQEQANRRREEVEAAIPEVREIDRELELSGLTIMRVSVEGGDVHKKIAEVRARNEELRRHRGILLAAHGYPADYTEPKYECTLCNDSGFVDTKMCVCMRRRMIESSYDLSGMGSLLRKQSFENFEFGYYDHDPLAAKRIRQIFRKMKTYAEDFSGATEENLVLFGNTGLGKTHLSSALARIVIERGYDVFYVSSIAMISDFEYRRFGNSAGGETGTDLDRYFDCDLLIIDDLGTEINNQFTTTVLYNLINTRLNRRKPVIISTNLTQEEFRTRYWDRITSRILGEYLVLPFEGRDIRALKMKRD